MYSDVGCGLCKFSLFSKPSSIWKPLGQDSNHPISVHRHWPRAQLNRIRSRFSLEQEGEEAADKFRQLYTMAFGYAIDEAQTLSRPKPNTSWMVLPYSLCVGGLQKRVSTLAVPSGLLFERVRLSWRLGGKHLIHLLRGFCSDARKKVVARG